jgi:hypothetical protein
MMTPVYSYPDSLSVSKYIWGQVQGRKECIILVSMRENEETIADFSFSYNFGKGEVDLAHKIMKRWVPIGFIIIPEDIQPSEIQFSYTILPCRWIDAPECSNHELLEMAAKYFVLKLMTGEEWK